MWLAWDKSVIYFVTICVANRKSVLANPASFEAFKHACAKLSHWQVLAGVLMPDHLHFVVAPVQDRDALVGNLSAAIKRWMREELHKSEGKRSACPTIASWRWQPGCFDRLLRSDESLHPKWLYVEENPVRAGFVKRFEEWPYRYAFNESTNDGDADLEL